MVVLEVDGIFVGVLVDLVDGFVYFLIVVQFDEMVNRYFVGQDNLYIVVVDLVVLGDVVKWEFLCGGDFFLYIYVLLLFVVVIVYVLFECGDDGRVMLLVVG